MVRQRREQIREAAQVIVGPHIFIKDSDMKQINWRNQIISVLSMFALLIAANYFDSWQELLAENFGETFERKFIDLRLWSVPVATVLFAVSWLVLFQFFIRHNHKFTAILFLLVGSCVVFYPTFTVSFGLLSILRLSVDYFSDSVFFNSGAFVTAMGLIGALTPAEK
jgi:hypothetical protein